MLIAGKRDDLAGMPIGHRKIAFLVAEMGQPRLAINGYGIVDFGLDPRVEAVAEQGIAVSSKYNVKVIDHSHIAGPRGNADLRECAEMLVVIGRIGDASGGDVFSVRDEPIAH